VENFTYIIYKITNKINGKIYIGRTTQGIDRRWKAHKTSIHHAKSKHLRLYKSMAKYGIENFQIEVLDTASDFNELKRKESEHILGLKSYQEDVGYNMSIDTDMGLEILSEDSLSRRRASIHKALSSKRIGKDGSGVRKSGDKYYAVITFDNHRCAICCDNARDAAIMRDKLSIHFHGKSASLNFPDLAESYTESEIKEAGELYKKHVDHVCLSKFIGVSPIDGKFVARIAYKKKQVRLGIFSNENDAAVAVDRARVYIHGPNRARINFPERISEYVSDLSNIEAWFHSVSIGGRQKGLNYDNRNEKYRVRIWGKDGEISLGYYEDPVEAAKIRDMGVIFFESGEPLNYPELEAELRLEATAKVNQILNSKKRYRGTSLRPSGRYMASVIHLGKTVRFGTYDTDEEAARAYDKGVTKLLGDKARLNFPVSTEPSVG
jgi:group I intron endonuclease